MQNTRLDRRSSSSNGGGLLEGPAAWLITFLVIPGLIAAVLLLPPISLLDRLQSFTYTRIGASGGAITDPDGTVVNFPAEGVISSRPAVAGDCGCQESCLSDRCARAGPGPVGGDPADPE
jgi:hypothetical protein